jgi:hypothetical protein
VATPGCGSYHTEAYPMHTNTVLQGAADDVHHAVPIVIRQSRATRTPLEFTQASHIYIATTKQSFFPHFCEGILSIFWYHFPFKFQVSYSYIRHYALHIITSSRRSRRCCAGANSQRLHTRRHKAVSCTLQRYSSQYTRRTFIKSR